jgi:hypothetical protein
MSSQKIRNVGRVETSQISIYAETSSGVVAKNVKGDFLFQVKCSPEHYERVIDLLYASRGRSYPQIDWSFLDAE